MESLAKLALTLLTAKRHHQFVMPQRSATVPLVSLLMKAIVLNKQIRLGKHALQKVNAAFQTQRAQGRVSAAVPEAMRNKHLHNVQANNSFSQ